MSNLLKNLLVALGLIGIMAVGYYLYSQSGGTEELLGVSGSGQGAAETQEFIRRLESIQSIEVSKDIFTDPRFQSLIDTRQQLTEETYGRPNPFEPLPEFDAAQSQQ